MSFAVGQRWTYAGPEQLRLSRIVIGALLEFPGCGKIACCSVTGALQKQADGTVAFATIPFLPMTDAALQSTVAALDGEGEVAEGFLDQFETWRADDRGLICFTVPFEGSLDRMIAMQMSEIVGRS